jgi:hypothetical protein
VEQKIDMLLEVYPDLEELFEVLDITPQRVLEVLFKGGHVSLPPFLEDEEEPELEEDV